MKNPRITALREKAAALPERPGVYLMKDEKGTILYVGKSRALKNRVSSYFVGTKNSYKTEKMVEKVRTFDTVLCDTEIEALTLENLLIKKHSPKYNIKLKDAKSYPYIKLSDESYPRLTVTRERKSDGGKYFGPYSGTGIAYSVVDTVRRIFALPSCNRVFPRDIGKGRPCLYRDMKRCIAPCDGSVTEESYRARITAAAAVLRGDIAKAAQGLEERMTAAAEEERYEEAAAYRDSIQALKKLREKQKVVGDEKTDADAVAFYADELSGAVSILSIRDGAMVSASEFLFSADEIIDAEGITAFLADYYGEKALLPKEILLSCAADESELLLLSESLTATAGHRVTVRVPVRGNMRKLCDMAETNAREKAAEYRRSREKEDQNLVTLAGLLGLEVIPDRIEAYDISNIGDEHITASMVVYADGALKKRDYRLFRVRVGEGRDDYASMKEALMRRLSHIGEGDTSLGARPDLIVLDGGMGQVNAVKEIMRESPHDIPVFGMVKDDFHKTRALTDGERELSFAKENGVYLFIYRLQEEAHRFAYSNSQKAKRKTLRHSTLTKISGIGDKKARLLFQAFGSIARIKEATVENLAAVRGLTEADAIQIHHYFHSEKEN